MFKAISKMKAKHQLLFAVVIGFAVVSFWRGAWGLMDEYFLPNNYRLSIWISLLLGIVILVATNYAAQELM